MEKLTKENIIHYYITLNYTKAQCSKLFDISQGKFYNLLKEYKIVKDRKAISASAKNTVQRRYNVDNISELDWVKDKKKETTLNSLGVENPSQAQSVKDKKRQTELAKLELNPEFFNEKKQKAIQTIMEANNWTYEEYVEHLLEAQRNTCMARYGVPFYSQTTEFHCNCVKKQYKFGDEIFDSIPELALWVYALDHNESIEHEPIVFIYEYDNKQHAYHLDFEYKGKYVEIKGDHFFNDDDTMCDPYNPELNDLYEAKHQCGLANNVEFWRREQYKKYEDWFLERYNPDDYLIKRDERR